MSKENLEQFMNQVADSEALQAQIGDFAFYLRKESIEIKYQDKNYVILPHSAILALVRSEEDDLLKDIEDLLDEEMDAGRS